MKAKRQSPVIELRRIIQSCLAGEEVRSLSKRSTDELAQRYSEFADFCAKKKIVNIQDLTPAVFEDFVHTFDHRNSPALIKAVVWAMRKLGSWLALNQLLPDNPAKCLQHPYISPRAKLPRYLKPEQLRNLLQTVYDTGTLQDFCVLSLLATVGLRPHEIAQLRHKDVNADEHYILPAVKGNWRKRTPISAAMAETLAEYLADVGEFAPEDRLFHNQWGAPIDKRWVLRMVKKAGRQAGLGDINPRMLRHTFATYAADRHGKEVTRALLGHAAGKNTDVYMHLIPSKFRHLMNNHPFQTRIDTCDKAKPAGRGAVKPRKRTPTPRDAHNGGGPLRSIPAATKENRFCIDKYLHYLQHIRCLAPHTVKRNNVVICGFLAHCESRKVYRLKDAQNQDMISWIAFREQSVCGRTIAREIAILRHFYEYLVAFHGPSSNPTTGLPKFMAGPSPETAVLSVNEVRRLLASCDLENPVGLRNYCIIALMWSSGLRSAELCALEWRDIDFENAILLVRKGKGRQQRQIFLNDRIRNTLKRYRDGMLWAATTSVFCGYCNTSSRSGYFEGGLTTNRLAKIITETAGHAGMRSSVTAKILRHCFATHLYEAGVHINDIKEMMGHKERSETTIYIHISLDAIKRTLNKHVSQTLYREVGQ